MRRRASTAVSLAVLTIAGLTIISSSGFAVAQDSPPAAPPASLSAEGAIPLQLEVYINDVSTELIATFRQNGTGSLFIEPVQLKNVGITPVESAKAEDGWIDISKLPDVTARYDESTQSIYFTVSVTARADKVIDASAKPAPQDDEEPESEAVRNWGPDELHDLWIIRRHRLVRPCGIQWCVSPSGRSDVRSAWRPVFLSGAEHIEARSVRYKTPRHELDLFRSEDPDNLSRR